MFKMVSILSIDAWGNADDGYEWNNWHKVGEVDVTVCDLPEEKVIAFMISEGYLNQKAVAGCYVDDDQYNMVICDKSNHMPLYAIAYGEAQ